MAGFWFNIQDHTRLSEQLLELQAAIGKPESRLLEGFHN